LILRKVLEYISEKGYIKSDEIVQELDISKGLVEHIIQELKKKEYLKVIAPIDEESACTLCPRRAGCHIKENIIECYVLTMKGKRLLTHSNENKTE